MSACLNPACSTDQPVLSWLDPDYCSHACRDAHGPLSEREPDLTCARKACPVVPDTSVRNAMGGYCSKTCIALDTPVQEEAWAAAMGRAIDGGCPDLPPAEAVEPLTPVPVGAETPEPPSEAQRAALREVCDRFVGMIHTRDWPTSVCTRCGKTYQPLGTRVDECGLCHLRRVNDELSGHPNGQTNPPIARSRWSRAWARLLRRTA